jgi:transposase
MEGALRRQSAALGSTPDSVGKYVAQLPLTQLQQWKEDATAALGEESQPRVSPQQTGDARKRIKELERDLRRKDKALAETTALLVLSKKFEAILQRDEEE